MNPYEPPQNEEKKYIPPIIDWEGLIFVLATFIIPVVLLVVLTYLFGK